MSTGSSTATPMPPAATATAMQTVIRRALATGAWLAIVAMMFCVGLLVSVAVGPWAVALPLIGIGTLAYAFQNVSKFLRCQKTAAGRVQATAIVSCILVGGPVMFFTGLHYPVLAWLSIICVIMAVCFKVFGDRLGTKQITEDNKE